jgi:spermidine synthase
VTLEPADFVPWVNGKPGPFDAILVDLDNGPEAFTAPGNAWLYSRAGLQALKAALRPGGILSVWSSGASVRFERRMREAGFEVEVIPVRGRPAVRKGSRHVLYSGRVVEGG